MSHWYWACHCCEPESCLIATADFNGDDSDTVKPADNNKVWIEIAGDWDNDTNRCKHVSTTPGICINETVNTFPGSNNMVVRCKFYGFADGSKHRIIVQSNLAGTDYFYGEWYYYIDGTPKMDFTLGSSSAGVIGTITGGSPIAEGTQCEVSVTEGGQLCMQDLSSRITECVTPKEGDYAGVGSAGVVGITFDDWEFWAHEMDRDDCPSCDCSCEGYCIEDDLTLEYEDISYCGNLDQVTHALTNAGPIKFGADWYTGAYSVGSPVDTHSFALRCVGAGSEGVSNLRLDILQGIPLGRKSDGASYDFPDPSVSTCEPLSLRFGPFTYGNVSHSGPPPCPETLACGGRPCDPDTSDFYIWVYE